MVLINFIEADLSKRSVRKILILCLLQLASVVLKTFITSVIIVKMLITQNIMSVSLELSCWLRRYS